MNCKICNTPPEDDLFSMVAQEPVCCVCKLKHIGGLPTTDIRITAARERLGLKDGEYIEQDRANECRKILGR